MLMAPSKRNVCLALSLSCGAIFFVLLAYTGAMLALYTPVFQRLPCVQTKGPFIISTDGVTWMNFTGSQTKTCGNPNNYDFKTVPNHDGEVSLKMGPEEWKVIGTSVTTEAYFPSGGVGSSTNTIYVNLPMASAGPMMAQPFLHITSSVHVKATSSMAFFGATLSDPKDSDSICGFEVRFQPPPSLPLISTANCESTLEELTIPAVGDKPEKVWVDLDDDVKAKAEKSKNILFSFLLVIFSLLGVSLTALGVVQVVSVLNESANPTASSASIETAPIEASTC